ncbi:MAG: chromate transporter, partial [Bacilli bacterium]
MPKRKNTHYLSNLFLTFFKIGILTFGGGYAMIPIIEKEVVEKQKWIDQSEMFDILSIRQSTP